MTDRLRSEEHTSELQSRIRISYAVFCLKKKTPVSTLVLPANTLIFQEAGLQVGVVDQNNRVQLRKVVVGRDFGTAVEVLSGLTPTDAVIANPSDSLNSGDLVQVESTQPNSSAQ